VLLSDLSPLRVLLTVVVGTCVAASAALLSGCAGEDVMTSAALASGDHTPLSPGQPDPASVGPPGSVNVVVTADQRAYLDALVAAGVHRSSDLVALSIGSYVCQARAAGQSDQGVWDFVFPLVRGDVHDMNPAATVTAAAPQARAATTQYIRIATDRLCSGEHSPK
jgi:hypothetical protein